MTLEGKVDWQYQKSLVESAVKHPRGILVGVEAKSDADATKLEDLFEDLGAEQVNKE